MSSGDKDDKTKGDDKKEKAVWNDNMVEIFIKICLQEVQDGNRPTTHFNKKGWKNLQAKFNRIARKDYEIKQIKNKWENLKKDWQIWRKLIGKEIGLGWNADKKTIEASDDWWERKIKEIPAAAKFREKGLLFANEMDLIFGDAVATRQHMGTPSSGSLLELGGATSQGIEGQAIDLEGSGDNGDMFVDTGVTDNLNLGGTTRGKPTETPIEKSTYAPVEEVRAKGKGKRKINSSTDSASWKKKRCSARSISMPIEVQQILASLERLVEAIESHVVTRKKKKKQEIQMCIDIIFSLPIEEGSMFFDDCLSLLIKNKDVREMLIALEEPELQLGFLQTMVADPK